MEYRRTTAGWKASYSYEKLMMTLLEQVVNPEEAVIMGGSWRIPVMEGLIAKNFVAQLKLDGTYNEASFAREYESIWSGEVQDAFFSSEIFDKHRVLQKAETEFTTARSKDTFYVIGVDVGRRGCTTEAVVFKVTPTMEGTYLKSLVYIESYDEEHFEQQAINLKKLYLRFSARGMCIDGNGLGMGLIDYMVKQQMDPKSGEVLPSFGVENDEEKFYHKHYSSDVIHNAIWVMKANAPLNTEMYSYAQSQLYGGKIKLLIDERAAKLQLMSSKVGRAMRPEDRAEYLRPYTLTTILKEEMLNLVEKNDGLNIILNRSSKGIKKDKFSAFIYGLFYIKKLETQKKRRSGLKGLMLFTSK